MKSVYTLLPYQRRFLEDKSRFKIGLFARQLGKSFCTGLDAVLDSISHPKSLWICLSAGERQSKEWMEKVRQHTEAVRCLCEFMETGFDADTASLVCRFPNGSRIIGLPANPNTARGYSGNVILDEFAFHDDSRAIWRALVPTITRGYRLTVVSTPNGTGNQFADLCLKEVGKAFSKHKVTILDAKADGLDVDVDALRAAVDDETWRQEYMCEFIDEAGAFLGYGLIGSCEVSDWERPLELCGPLYVGFDVARKKDLSVIWVNEFANGRHVCRKLVEMRDTPFSVQRDVLWDILSLPNVRRCCIDKSGLGMQIAEETERRFGSWKAEGIQFSAPVKEALAYPLRSAMEDGNVRIPERREVREDLHKIRKVTTAAGNVRFQAEADEAGHADRFWALALAIHAASDSGPVFFEPLSTPLDRPTSENGGPDHSDDRY